ncbi:MAG: T9SS type A sorting domain-containing protein [Bacteroidia bacterium]
MKTSISVRNFLMYLTLFVSVTSMAQTTLISKVSSWKYLDDGSDQGTSWVDSGFNDAGWSTGNAVLGYGGIFGTTLGTTVSYGSDASNKYPTTYFRKEVTISSPDYTYIYLSLLCDDGAAIYINGKLAHTYNMPGSWSYSSYASATVAGADEGDYTTYAVPDTFFVDGVNVIAVELHNRSGGSSDLGFDLEVSAEKVDAIFLSGGTWNYLDDGTDQGTSWRDSGFNDAGWSSGDAVFGYGTIDGATINTTISYGSDANNKYQTTYFRKEFSLTNPSYTHLDLSLMCDDGAVIYINGKEALRYNMPDTNVYTTYALSAISAADEGDFQVYEVLDSFLINGVNTIAVEIHQVNASSSDLSFDLQLSGKNQRTAYGRLYMDVDASETFNSGDLHGSGAVEVRLYNDADSNGVYDQDEIIDSTLSDPLGYYSMTFSNQLTHVAIVLVMDDLDPVTIMTTDTAFAFTTADFANDTAEAWFGMIGPRSLCLGIADDQSAEDRYYMINRLTGKNQYIGQVTGRDEIESLAIKLGMDTVWAADAAQLGWIELQTGQFNAVGTGIGSGSGTIGGTPTIHDFVDIDGMGFDPLNDILYGTEATESASNDLLIAIDRSTGTLIEDFFGAGIDYVEISGPNIKPAIDDISFNPITGELLAINNLAGTGDSTRYISIDPTDGSATVIADIGVGDMEGMGYYNNGDLYGTTGIISKTGYPMNTFYSIDRATGLGTKVDSLYSGAIDVEACGCLTGPAINMMSGVVFYDVDSSGTYNRDIDSIESTVIVHLYRDANENGAIDSGDYIIDSAYSNGANGIYLFMIDSLGSFLTRPQIIGTPLQNLNTTTNDSLTETATYINYGETDGGNDFGFHISAGMPPILPVHWLSVSADWEDKHAKIDWVTASEQDNSHFEVQRSLDGENFVTVGQTPAAGNTDEITNYDYLDLYVYDLTQDDIYYRIKQVDYNADFEYSDVVVLHKNSDWEVLGWPMPFEDEINVSLSKGALEVQVELLDVTGAVLYSETLKGNLRQSQHKITNLSHLSQGIYFLRVSRDNEAKIIKLIK